MCTVWNVHGCGEELVMCATPTLHPAMGHYWALSYCRHLWVLGFSVLDTLLVSVFLVIGISLIGHFYLS